MTICRSIVLNILRAHPDGVTTSAILAEFRKTTRSASFFQRLKIRLFGHESVRIRMMCERLESEKLATHVKVGGRIIWRPLP